MSRSQTIVVAAIAGTFVVSAVAALISPPHGSSTGRGITSPAAAREYRREAQSLQARGLSLAPGWHWPLTLTFPSTGPDGAPMSYAKGYAAGQADSYWYHSWASRAVSVRDAVARLAALRQLSRVRETAYYKALLPADRAYLDQTISQALRGDLTRLRESAAASGPGG